MANLRIWVSLACVVVLAGLVQADTITVGPGGGYDYTTIQAGIDAATSGDIVEIAQGTYATAGDYGIDFGGKAITVRSTDPCDWDVVKATIIDCENSERGFYFHNGEGHDSVLAGLTITNGSAPGGGGIYCNGSSPTISRCIIKNNSAEVGDNDGGGIKCRTGSNSIIEYCIITGNSAYNTGGGIYCRDSNITISNCVIADNYIYGGGGGLYCERGTTTIKQCVIISNEAELYDGGAISNDLSNITVSNCIIWNNLTRGSLAEPLDGVSLGDLTYNDVQGGFSGTGNIDVDPCFVDAAGGDYHLKVHSPCIDSGDPNYISSPGETDIDGGPRIVNDRIDMGVDEFIDEPFIRILPAKLQFSSYIVGSNPEPQILSIDNIGTGELNWEITENCSWLEVDPNSGTSSGEANEVTVSIDSSGLDLGTYDCNLLFFDPCAINSPRTISVCLSIVNRPVIALSQNEFEFYSHEGGLNPEDQILSIWNSGDSTLNWEISVDCNWLSVSPDSGNSTGGTNEATLSVNATGLIEGTHNCNLTISDPASENNPQMVAVTLCLYPPRDAILVPEHYGTIQDGIDAANNGDTVLVADGTYTGPNNKNLDFGGLAITLQSENGPENCIIDCENSGRGFYFHSGEDANSIVAGFTIKNGKILGTFDSPDVFGGGIYCSNASPTITNCYILNNSVYGMGDFLIAGDAYGGGIYCVSNSHPTILDCEISGNLAKAPSAFGASAHAYGGGVFCSSDNSTVTIYNSRITANVAHGGKTWSTASWQSWAKDSYGGGIFIGESIGSIIKNCLIVNNETVLVIGETYEGTNYGKSQGAGIFCKSDVNVVNCTVVGNYTDPTGVRGDGGGIYGPATVINNIIRDNISSSQLFGTTSVTYSDIEGGYSGTGNIDADPLFVTGTLGDYYLSQVAAGQASDSPCVNMGSDTAANLGMDIFTTRTDKVWDEGFVDMGYHYSGNLADLNDSGHVDLGDFAILASQWQDIPGVPSADIAPDGGDGIVDEKDLEVFCNNWLW